MEDDQKQNVWSFAILTLEATPHDGYIRNRPMMNWTLDVGGWVILCCKF